MIPSHRPQLLELQLGALADQRFDRPWEVVVVTAAARPARLPDGIELRWVLLDRPASAARARNIGAAAARGERLAFCDDDDEVAPGWLAALVAGLDEVDAVGGPNEVGALNGADAIGAWGHGPGATGSLPTVSGWCPYIESGNLGIRRSVFESVGGFDEHFASAEDRDLGIRLRAAGFSVGFAPGAVIQRRLRQGTWPQLRQSYRWGRADVFVYRCHRRGGMPPAGADGGWRAWARLARDLPQVTRRAPRGAWLSRLAERTGRLVGSVRHRTWYL